MRLTARFTSSGLAGPWSCAGVSSTGTVVSRNTRSAVEPKNSLRTPVSPCVLITTRSGRPLAGDAQDLDRGLAGRYDQLHVVGRHAALERLAHETPQLLVDRFRQVLDRRAELGCLAQQGIGHGHDRELGLEMIGDHGRIPQRAA